MSMNSNEGKKVRVIIPKSRWNGGSVRQSGNGYMRGEALKDGPKRVGRRRRRRGGRNDWNHSGRQGGSHNETRRIRLPGGRLNRRQKRRGVSEWLEIAITRKSELVAEQHMHVCGSGTIGLSVEIKMRGTAS